MSPEPTVAVQLPQDLHRRIQERLKGSSFRSVDDFVAFVLARLAERPVQDGEPLSAKDEAQVRERLRSLGYID